MEPATPSPPGWHSRALWAVRHARQRGASIRLGVAVVFLSLMAAACSGGGDSNPSGSRSAAQVPDGQVTVVSADYAIGSNDPCVLTDQAIGGLAVNVLDGTRTVGTGTLSRTSFPHADFDTCWSSASISWVNDPSIDRQVASHIDLQTNQATPAITTNFSVMITGFSPVPVTMVAGVTDLSLVTGDLTYDATNTQTLVQSPLPSPPDAGQPSAASEPVTLPSTFPPSTAPPAVRTSGDTGPAPACPSGQMLAGDLPANHRGSTFDPNDLGLQCDGYWLLANFVDPDHNEFVELFHFARGKWVAIDDATSDCNANEVPSQFRQSVC